MKKRNGLIDKLNCRLNDDPVLEEFDSMLHAAISTNRFVNSKELKNHLVEGAILNVGRLASKALSIPCGDYIVWMTDAGHTMLVPAPTSTNEVFENSTKQYDIFTNTLLQNWNKLQKGTISEAKGYDDEYDEYDDYEDEEDDDYEDEEDDDYEDDEDEEDDDYEDDEDEEDDDYEDDDYEDDEEPEFSIDPATVDRIQILRSMEDTGHTVTSLARAVNVDPPAISRILRTPKRTEGDPGGRNPSMGLASQICAELRIEPTTAFPDIFGTANYKPRRGKKNRGSGKNTIAAKKAQDND